MISFSPLREILPPGGFTAGDTLAIFGEVFARGYVNGLIEEAQKQGLQVIYATVGRRDDEGRLRPLTAEELKEKNQPLINIPLEAGFDMEPDREGITPVAQLQGVKMSDWDKVELNVSRLEDSRQRATERFRTSTQKYLEQLKSHLKPGKRLIFAHIMAGGVPRAKIMMPTMNKVFKGTDERFLSSETFWKSPLGRLCEQNFQDVTAETFRHLIELSAHLREDIVRQGGSVSYLAYGYHGTEILVGNSYDFQYYSPYLQGWAKMKLEDHAQKFFEQGVSATVFNAPEILTNSSSIFQGVEVPLYPLMAALEKESGGRPRTDALLKECQAKLKPGISIKDVKILTDKYFSNKEHQSWWPYEKWPNHNNPQQMKLMKETSQQLIDMHVDPKNLITFPLSELVFQMTGKIMFREAWKPRQAVWWVGHDIIAKEASKA